MASDNAAGFTVFPAPGLNQAQWAQLREILEERAWESSTAEDPCKLRFADAPAAQQDWRRTVEAAAREQRARPIDRFRQSMFIFVDEQSASSILGTQGQQSTKPYVFAVDQWLGDEVQEDDDDDDDDDDEDDEDSFRGWFKVHLNSIGELFRCVKDETLAPEELGVGLAESDIWLYIDEKTTG